MRNLINKMYEIINTYGLESKQALDISQKLDELITMEQLAIYHNYKENFKNNC